MRRRFVTLDVFASRRFAGNPLGVVLEPDGLDTDTMQAITREFGHPETIFVFPPADPKNRARLRIFTPGLEIPFAGHPTVGAAVLFARLDGGNDARVLVLEESIGPVRCMAEPKGTDHGRATFEVPMVPERGGGAPETAMIAKALGLETDDIGFDALVPQRWSAGNAFCFVPLRNLDAVKRARPDMSRFDEVFGNAGRPGMVYVFSGDTTAPEHDFHARMFAPGMGIPEDPATGSAAAAMAGLLATDLPDGDQVFIIEQGFEMSRPSLMRLTLTKKDGRLAGATIGGEAVVVTEGTIEA